MHHHRLISRWWQDETCDCIALCAVDSPVCLLGLLIQVRLARCRLQHVSTTSRCNRIYIYNRRDWRWARLHIRATRLRGWGGYCPFSPSFPPGPLSPPGDCLFLEGPGCGEGCLFLEGPGCGEVSARDEVGCGGCGKEE